MHLTSFCFKCQGDLISTCDFSVQPSSGLLEPNQKLLLTASMTQHKYPCFLESEIRCQINQIEDDLMIKKIPTDPTELDNFFREETTTVNIIFIRLKVSMRLEVS